MKALVNGVTVEGEELSFTATTEPWADYVAEDGTRVRLRLCLTRLIRTQAKDEMGRPVYHVEAQASQVITPGDEG